MSFKIGSQVHHYAITGKLGEGGMGTVYAAEDTQLGRRVAIKVLPADLASDPERLHRFEREARTVAALNHPNVVTLYSVDEISETRFLTMELIDGVSLTDFIGPDGVASLDDFFRLALPLVEAIASAHERGVTHRDLKPSNIMIDGDGRVKVLDFGLAKLTEGSPLVAVDDTELPTNVMTGKGQIVGTVAYMSPQQAEGQAVDARADIFSLGVLFYEMLTGAQPFTGDSPMSTLSAIMLAEPDPIVTKRPNVPRQLQRIIDHCLAKDPDRRYQTVIDLRNALDSLRDELREAKIGSGELHLDAFPVQDSMDVPGPIVDPEVSGGAQGWLRGAALVALGGLIGFALASFPDTAIDVPAPAAMPDSWDINPLLTRLDQMPSTPSFHPEDGTLLYSLDVGGQTDLFRRTSEGVTENLTESEESETEPVHSPVDDTVAYSVVTGPEQGIHERPTVGGAGHLVIERGRQPAYSPQRGRRLAFALDGKAWVADAGTGANAVELTDYFGGPIDPAWSPDERSVFVWSEVHLGIVRVPADGSKTILQEWTVPVGQQVGSIQVAPEANMLVFTMGQYGGHMSVYTAALDPETGDIQPDSTRITNVVSDDRYATISRDGSRIAYVVRDVERHLWAQQLDTATGLGTSLPPQQLTRGERLNYYPATSRDGLDLAWTAHGVAGFLHRMDLRAFVFGRAFEGVEEKVTAERDAAVREINPGFYDDVSRLLFSSTDQGLYHLSNSPCPRCPPNPLSEPPEDTGGDYYPALSPDQSSIAFTSLRDGSESIWLMSAEDPDAPPVPLTDSTGTEQFPTWARDSRRVIYRALLAEGGSDLMAVDIYQTGERTPFVSRPGEQTWSAWSIDGERLYFASNESGAFEIWMRHANGDIEQVTNLATNPMGLRMPEVDMFTKFAVGRDMLVLPLEMINGTTLFVAEPSGAPAAVGR